MRDYFNRNGALYFQFPLDGDCLNQYDGEEHDGELLIKARVCGMPGGQVFVNEIPAAWDGTAYAATLSLRHYRTTLEAVDQKNGARCAVAVYRLSNAVGRYRLSSDDNILFLQDLHAHREEYQSLFDNPYLAIYKKAHDLFGACVHLNLYYKYTEEEMKDFSAHKNPFNLSMMTDRFKGEWEANADWLQLSFHARRNNPDSPYLHARRAEIAQDIELVHREILRFAGPKTLSPVTTLHFGAANLTVTRVLREYGYRGLAGYFEITPENETLVSYHYPIEWVRHVGERDFWKDQQEDVMLGRIDLVLNAEKEPQPLIDQLEEIQKNHPGRAGFLSLLMHEEYFYPDYKNNRPRFEELVLKPCQWCYEHGYQGGRMQDTLFEPQHPLKR